MENNEERKSQEIVHFEYVLPPTVEHASIILSKYLETHPELQLSKLVNKEKLKPYGDPDQLIRELFGISDELYISCILENCCGFPYDAWKEPKSADIRTYVSNFKNVEIMGEYMNGFYISAEVPEYWKAEEPIVITREDVEEMIENDKNLLPKRSIKDLQPVIYREIIENVAEGNGWIIIDEENERCHISEYPEWFDLISLVSEEVGEICLHIAKVCTMPFGEFIKKCGYTKRSFARRYFISVYTLDEWIYRNPPKMYLRILFAESCGLLPPFRCDHHCY